MTRKPKPLSAAQQLMEAMCRPGISDNEHADLLKQLASMAPELVDTAKWSRVQHRRLDVVMGRLSPDTPQTMAAPDANVAAGPPAAPPQPENVVPFPEKPNAAGDVASMTRSGMATFRRRS